MTLAHARGGRVYLADKPVAISHEMATRLALDLLAAADAARIQEERANYYRTQEGTS